MRNIFRTTPRRSTAVLVALTIVGITSFATLRDSQAAAAVTPTTSIAGLVVYPPGGSVDVPTAVYPVTNGDGSFNLFALYPNQPVGEGAEHYNVAWASLNGVSVGIISQLVSLFDASSQSALEIAATQAAIWHITSGWEPDRAGANSPEFLTRYDELLALATANPDTETDRKSVV